MQKRIRNSVCLFFMMAVFAACNNQKKEETSAVQAEKKLPIFGMREYDEEKKDTVYHTIPDFEFINQDGEKVNNETLKGKIYVADFFFTTCQTICPRMTSQLKRVSKQIEGWDDVMFVSYTVDPETDSVETLKAYANDNGINTKKWIFITGDEEEIHELGGSGYLLNVLRDSTAQGGFLHSELFILVDKERHIRGIYDGTNTEDVNRMMKEIQTLRKEYGE